jgi:poly(A) polymerase
MRTLTHPIPDWLAHGFIHDLMQLFTAQGHELRVVGGCVRDMLMHRPVTEIDAGTTATPEQTVHILQHAGIRAIPTGIAHGTITAYHPITPIEITTLRSDITCDGRHADVRFSTNWQEDALRRDFTINALSMDAQGTLYDYTNGLEDIAQQRIRFIGDATQRIQEDYLRILRFFRFLATHGNPAQPADQHAIQACAQLQSGLLSLSAERIQHEMLRLLSAPQPTSSLTHLHRCGIDQTISGLPWHHIPALDGLLHWEQRYACPPNPLVRLCVLTNASPQRNTLLQRWKCARTQQQFFQQLCTLPPLPHDEAQLKAFIRQHGHALSTACIGRDVALGIATTPQRMQLCQSWYAPIFPVSGHDLMALGYTSGKALGEALHLLELQWEASNYTLSKEQLLISL